MTSEYPSLQAPVGPRIIFHGDPTAAIPQAKPFFLFQMRPPPDHYAHLPYSREPLKSLYVSQRLVITLLFVPYWIVYYTLCPRPRPSWSLKQCIYVAFTRRIYKVTEVAGVTWGTRDPTAAPTGRLKETRFEWVEPLAEDLRTGVVVANNVPFMPVGAFVWPKEAPVAMRHTKTGTNFQKPSTIVDPDVETSAADVPVIGLFMHGGGYCHMSAGETSRTSRIPRHLMKNKQFTEIYSVEYRLIQHAPFPAVIQDAAAVYAHVVRRYGARTSKCKIILIGDSSGGNLVLALARWVRDEGKLPLPDGLLLLSPSCDISHAFPDTPSSYIPRPNADTDYLVDTPEPRALLQRAFLGFKYRPERVGNRTLHHRQDEEERRFMEVVHSEYVSPASPRVLRRWDHSVEQHYRDDVGGIGQPTPEDLAAALDAETQLDVETQLNAETRLNAETQPDAEARLDAAVQKLPPEDSPFGKSKAFKSLFEGFPRTLVIVGDAERLETEVKSLVGAMERDGVDVMTEWVPDAVHDILTIADGWWDEKVRAAVWKVINDCIESI